MPRSSRADAPPSIAHAALVEKLTEHVDCRLTADHVDRLAHELMPVVRDAVARGFDTAARLLADEQTRRKLQQWAQDVRADRRPVTS